MSIIKINVKMYKLKQIVNILYSHLEDGAVREYY